MLPIYKHSGTVPLSGGLTTVFVSLAMAVVLGVIYPFTFYYIPIIYLWLLITLGLSWWLGTTVGTRAKAGRIRSLLFVTCVAILAAVVMQYVSWGFTPYARCHWDELGDLWKKEGLATLLPSRILALAQDMYTNGGWKVRRQTVSGWFLAGIWLAEGGTIFYLTTHEARSAIRGLVYCEACETWLTHEPVLALRGTGTEPQWQEVQSGRLEALNDFTRVAGYESSYIALTVATCERCHLQQYLSAKLVSQEKDGDGDPKTKEKPIFTNLVITPEQLTQIEVAGHLPSEPPIAESIEPISLPSPQPPDDLPQIRV